MLLTIPVAAQQPDSLFNDIAFKTVPGSPSERSVTTIVQDFQGFLWFGTRNGLNRYDGLEFRVYEHLHHDSTSLSDGYISTLFEDSRNDLWIGTWSGGLNRYDRDQDAFIHFRHDPKDPTSLSHPRVHTIFEDSEKNLWVGTENGLNLFHPETGTFTRFFHDESDPNSLADSEVRKVFEDRFGNLWVGTYGGGLDRFDPSTGHFIHYRHRPDEAGSISSDFIRSAFQDEGGDLWIGTRYGLNLLVPEDDGQSFHFRRFLHNPADPNSLPNNVVISISQDDSHRMWFGTENGGLSLYDKEQDRFANFLQNPLQQNNLQSNSIWSLYKDQVGTMWVGAYNSELVTWNRFQSKFRHHYVLPHRNALSNNNVTCFLEDHKGNLWIGTDGGGLNYYNRQTGVYTHYLHDPDDEKSISSNAVISLMKDADDNIWIGTWGGGLNRFDQQTQTFTRYLHDPGDASSIGSNNVFTMLIDSKGRFWVGAFYSGLDLFDPDLGTFRHFTPQSGKPGSLSDHRVFKILEDSRGNLWIGTQGGGLNLLREGRDEPHFIQYRQNHTDSTALGGDIILSLLEDHNGNLWVGTYGEGLSRFDPDERTFTTYRKGEGLYNQVINGILEDDQGHLWLSTNDGIARFEPKKEAFKQYDVSDGLQAREFIRGACYKTAQGELLFGGVNGFNAFFPHEVSANPYLPAVYLTDFRIFNKSIKPGEDAPLKKNITETEKLVLDHQQNVFSFEISALNYTQSGKNQFAYQLEGYDKDWQYTGTRRNAYYTKVPPGHYTFRAKAANNNGLWNEEGVAVEIIINPPWYKTYWAYGLYLIILAGLFWAYQKHLIRRERLKNALQLEHLELQKMKEMDRIKSNFFANIAHEFRTPLALIRGPLQRLHSGNFPGDPKRQFRIMLRNTEKLLNLINQLLDLSKLGAGSMKLKVSQQDFLQFLHPIVRSFHSYAKIQHIQFHFNHPDREIPLWFDPEKLEQIMNNFLSNAFKFTPEKGVITVGVSVLTDDSGADKWVEVEIKDTGIGIPAPMIDSIFDRYYQARNHEHYEHRGTGIGLSLTKELIELHRGSISVESEVNKGSSFTMRLPVGKDHLQHATIVEREPEVVAAMETAPLSNKDKAAEQAPKTSASNEENDLPLVLVVEDDEDFRSYVAEHLETSYRLEEANNGKDAYDMAVRSQPDLIISDVVMDQMDGFELCRKIKSDDRTSHIPVVLVTGRACAESEMTGIESGADLYIVKPFNSKLLELRIRNILKSRRSLREQLSGDQPLDLEPKKVKLISADKKLLGEALACVERNMDNSDFTVEDCSRELGMSRMQLYRKLKAATGQSPNDFIRTVRLKRAAQLIEQNQMTIAQVTYSVGFNDLQYFRQCFRKQFGVTPSKYNAEEQGRTAS